MAMWIRTYYEYLECKKLGGFALFVTLTYRNSTIPRLNNDERFKCFSKRDCQKYIKRVRQAIARKYPTIDTSNSIRYLCTSEYGGRTHRPHYHLAFFVRCPLHRWSVRRIVADSWHLGYTKFGSRNYGFIDSVGALHYVSKYICKDVYEEDYFKKFFEDYCKEYVSDYSPEIARKYLKPFLPFYLISNNLGMYLLNEIDDKDLYLGRVCMPDTHLIRKFYKLPLYYDRKFFYDVKYKYFDNQTKQYIYTDSRPVVEDFTPVYSLNSRGSEMKIERCKTFYEAAQNVYCNAIHLNTNFNLEKFNEKFCTNFKKPYQLSGFLAKKVDKDTYCRYSILYSGVHCPLFCLESGSQSTSFVEDYNLMQRGKENLSVLDRDLNSFYCNCRAHQSIKDIDLVCEMINYVYYLCKKSFERSRIDSELEYIDKKTEFLRSTEVA